MLETYNPLIAGIEELRESWGWFLVLGILLTVLGAICVAYDVTATFSTVYIFGWLLLIGGVFTLVHAFRTHTWSGFFLYLLSGLLRGFTGYLLVRYTLTGAEALTLTLASLLVVLGLFRAIGAGVAKFPRWGWSALAGIISALLGIMLLAEMPLSTVWFIGFALGVDFIVDGVSVISFAVAVHSLPARTAYQTA